MINGPISAAPLGQRRSTLGLELKNTLKLDSVQIVNLRPATTNFFLTLPV